MKVTERKDHEFYRLILKSKENRVKLSGELITINHLIITFVFILTEYGFA